MENATKALLIAAAVLIAILLISFGVFIITSVQGTIQDSVNMSDLEIQQFNQKFKNYEGTSVAGSRVNTLIETVYNHNLTESDESKRVAISGGDTDLNMDKDPDNVTSKPKAETGSRYTVECVQDKKSALVTSIKITKNTSSGTE